VRCRGVALLLVLVTLPAVLIVAIGLLAAQGTSTQISRNISGLSQAQAIAESGLDMAIRHIKANSSTWRTARGQGVWVQDGGLAGGTVTISAMDGWDSNSDGVIEGDGDLANNNTDPVTLLSTGKFNGATHTAQAVLTPLASYVTVGLASAGAITIQGSGSKVDSYDSSLGAYGGGNVGQNALVSTNSTAAQDVKVQTGAQVKGAVEVGPGGDPAAVVYVDGASTITGGSSALSQALPMPTLAEPTGLGPSTGDLSYEGNHTEVISGNLHVNNLTIKANYKIQISGDVTILADGLVDIWHDNSGLEILPGSSLKLYFKNGLNIRDGASVVVDGANLSRMQFINLGTAGVTLDNTSAQGVIMSPNAPVQMTNGFQFYGAILDQSISISGGSGLHEDKNVTTGPDRVLQPGISVYKTSWGR
jgi:hypothetical protein